MTYVTYCKCGWAIVRKGPYWTHPAAGTVYCPDGRKAEPRKERAGWNTEDRKSDT